MAAPARSRRCCAAMRFPTAVHDLCAPRCRKHFFSMLHPLPTKALLSTSRRRPPVISSRSSGGSRRFSAPPRRSPLSLGRFAMTCTAASLSHADECAASVFTFVPMLRINFSASHILPTKALLSASRRRPLVSSSRSSEQFAPIFRTAASFFAFAGAVRNDLHRRVTQLR